MNKRFDFTGFIMAVMIGFVLSRAPEVIINDLSFSNFRAVLMVLGILVYLEMYLILHRYHFSLEISYSPLHLMIDIFNAFLYMVIMHSILESGENVKQISVALGTAALLILINITRQYMSYRFIVTTGGVNAIRDEESKENQNLIFQKNNLRTPMVLGFLGVAACMTAAIMIDNGRIADAQLTVIAWVGLAAFLLYLVFNYLGKFTFKPQL